MNPNAKELTEPVNLIQIMSYGHLLMEDMVTINAISVNKLLILEESNSLNAIMVRSLNVKSLESTVHALTWTMNVIMVSTDLMMADVLLIV